MKYLVVHTQMDRYTVYNIIWYPHHIDWLWLLLWFGPPCCNWGTRTRGKWGLAKKDYEPIPKWDDSPSGTYVWKYLTSHPPRSNTHNQELRDATWIDWIDPLLNQVFFCAGFHTFNIRGMGFINHMDFLSAWCFWGLVPPATCTPSRSPLWVAARNGHLAVVQTLIGAGARIDLTDLDGRSPAQIAKRFNHQRVLSRGCSNPKTWADGSQPQKSGQSGMD